jgi:hypothetical protein
VGAAEEAAAAAVVGPGELMETEIQPADVAVVTMVVLAAATAAAAADI